MNLNLVRQPVFISAAIVAVLQFVAPFPRTNGDEGIAKPWSESLAPSPSFPVRPASGIRWISDSSADNDESKNSRELLPPTEVDSTLLDEEQLPDVLQHIQRRHTERSNSYHRLMQRLQDILNTPAPVLPPALDTDTQAADLNPVPDRTPDGANEDPKLTTSPKENSDPGTQPPVDNGNRTSPSPSPEMMKPTPVAPLADSSQGASPTLQNPLPPPQPKPSSVFEDSLSAKTMIDGPVDRIGLADNLYAVDEFQIALNMYQEVDLNDIPASERYWVRYQTACCMRRLGQVSEAQSHFRRLAGVSDAGWLASMSRWWLDQMDARMAVEKQIDEQTKFAAALSEVLNADNVTE